MTSVLSICVVYFTFAFSIRIVISPTVPYSEATEPRVPVGLDEAITSNVLLLRNIYATNDLMYVPLVNTSCCFPHSWHITGFVTRVTRRVPLVEQELLNIPEHLRSPPVFGQVYVARSLVFCVVFCRSLFILFLLTMVLSVLRFTYSNGSFSIFKLFLSLYCISWLSLLYFMGPSWSWSYGSWIYTPEFVISNPAQVRCTRYNIMW